METTRLTIKFMKYGVRIIRLKTQAQSYIAQNEAVVATILLNPSHVCSYSSFIYEPNILKILSYLITTHRIIIPQM